MATAKKTNNICWKECLERETFYAADWYGPSEINKCTPQKSKNVSIIYGIRPYKVHIFERL